MAARNVDITVIQQYPWKTKLIGDFVHRRTIVIKGNWL